MTSFLLAIHIFLAFCLIGLILLQKSEGGTGLGGGASNAMFTARGAANLLTRTTAVLAALFMLNCIVMSALTSRDLRRSSSILDHPQPQAPTPASKTSP